MRRQQVEPVLGRPVRRGASGILDRGRHLEGLEIHLEAACCCRLAGRCLAEARPPRGVLDRAQRSRLPRLLGNRRRLAVGAAAWLGPWPREDERATYRRIETRGHG